MTPDIIEEPAPPLDPPDPVVPAPPVDRIHPFLLDIATRQQVDLQVLRHLIYLRRLGPPETWTDDTVGWLESQVRDMRGARDSLVRTVGVLMHCGLPRWVLQELVQGAVPDDVPDVRERLAPAEEQARVAAWRKFLLPD